MYTHHVDTSRIYSVEVNKQSKEDYASDSAVINGSLEPGACV